MPLITKISINFDLKIKKLREYYPKKSYTLAYYDIEKFMLNHGFEHQQGSGYVSEKPMSIASLGKLLKKMTLEYEWLHKTTQISKATHVLEESFNLEKIINKPYRKLSAKNKQNEKTPKPKLVPKVKDPKTKTNNLSR